MNTFSCYSSNRESTLLPADQTAARLLPKVIDTTGLIVNSEHLDQIANVKDVASNSERWPTTIRKTKVYRPSRNIFSVSTLKGPSVFIGANLQKAQRAQICALYFVQHIN